VSDTAAQAPVINISLLEEFIQTVRSTAIEEIKTTQQLIDSKAAKQIIITQLELLQAHNEDHRYQSLIKSLGQIGYQLMVAISSAPTDLTTNTQHFTDVSTRLVACGRGCGKSIRLAYDTVQGKNVTVDATELKLHRCQMTDLGAVSAGVVLVENTIPAPKRALRWIEIEKKNPSERTAEEEKLLLGLRALFEKQDANTINLDQSDADRDAAGYRSKLELTEEAA
jgi:hypothetical protein